MPELLAVDVEALKHDIHVAVVTAMHRFTTKAGLTPSAIDLLMVDVTPQDNGVRVHVLGDVRVRFDV